MALPRWRSDEAVMLAVATFIVLEVPLIVIYSVADRGTLPWFMYSVSVHLGFILVQLSLRIPPPRGEVLANVFIFVAIHTPLLFLPLA